MSNSWSDEPYGTGKWLVEIPLGDPDEIWERIVMAACDGRVAATKISSEKLDEILGHHMVCVYCRLSDKESVGETLRVLRELGVQGSLFYKSDRATHAGVDDHLWHSDGIEMNIDNETLYL